jgi:hypothetical protein
MASKQPPNFDSVRKTFVPPQSQNTATVTTTNRPRKISAKTVGPNIMEQMISYNEKSTSFMINQLSEEINDQKEMNHILNGKSFSDNIEEINTFVEKNKDLIPEQTTDLENLFDELKRTIDENYDLKEEQGEYKELLQNEEVIKISGDMVRLKSLKNDIVLFLQSNGIRM